MSQIAQALAKAKERTGQTNAPFLSSGASASPVGQGRSITSQSALRQARNRQRLWLIVGLVALPLTGFVVWTQVRGLAAPSAASSSSLAAPAGTHPQSEASSNSSETTSPPKVAAPRPELVQAVANLAISAVTPGDPAKIVLGCRVIRAGQTIDGGLTFAGIADGQLHFTDAAGALYTRRY